MKNRHLLAGLLAAVGAMFSDIDVEDVDAETTNSWVKITDGQWDGPPSQWSVGRPSISDAADLITNASSKAVTIDNTTDPARIVISNLTIRGFGASTNTLLMTTTNTLVVLNTLIVGTNAALSISNSNLRVDGQLGGNFLIDGSVVFHRGSVVTTSNVTTTVIGDNTGGSLTMIIGTMSNGDLVVGNNAGASGVFTMTGGTNVVAGAFTAGKGASATGTVFMTDSLVVMTNAPTVVGSNGIAQVSVTNGVLLCRDFIIGHNTGAAGTLTIAGGTNTLSSSFKIGLSAGATGAVWVTGGQLIVTNVGTIIGHDGVGQMTVSNGTFLCRSLQVANGPGTQGTLTVAGGTATVSSDAPVFSVGNTVNATGTVWVTGGELGITNYGAETYIGKGGVGRMTVSNGTWQSAGNLYVAVDAGSQGSVILAGGTWLANHEMVGRDSQGTLTVAGGTNLINSYFATGLEVGGLAGATGTVWLTDGLLTVTNSFAQVGEGGVGNMTISNGTLLAGSVRLALSSGSRGTLTVVGGTSVLTNLTVGNLSCTATGIVNVAGGNLFVTNAAGNAVLDVRSGTVTLSVGTLVVDNLVITNSCGHFVHTGGTLSITTTNVAANLDADGDGLPNGWEASFGLDAFNDTGDSGASGDPDSDGYTNLQEFNAGTNPNDAGSNPDANSWTNSVSGKWERGANWVLTIPPASNQTVFVTNATTKVVTIDATTTTTPATMTITNLVIGGPAGTINMLQLTNAGAATPLRVRNLATISSGGALLVTNSMLVLDQTPFFGQTIDGDLTLLPGAVVSNASSTVVGSSLNTTGAVWITGGQLIAMNRPTDIGRSGVGQVTLSNGTFLARDTRVGRETGAQGTLTIVGGTNAVAESLTVGVEPGAQGTVTVASGLAVVSSNLTIGRFACDSTAIVTVNGGTLAVTNGAATGVLDVRGGTLQFNSGTLVIDNLVISNACGRFFHYGGTLSVGNTNNVLPNLDADGDGLPNSFEQTYGLDPFNDTGNDGPSGDPDGDGFTNLQESQAGTDPNDSSSSFRITAVTKEGNGLRITWSMGPGKSNVLQRTAGTANGSYSNNFADIFTIPYTVGTTTNYLDVGAATNFPSRYYRVRLVP